MIEKEGNIFEEIGPENVFWIIQKGETQIQNNQRNKNNKRIIEERLIGVEIFSFWNLLRRKIKFSFSQHPNNNS